jgi:hypothetical protein
MRPRVRGVAGWLGCTEFVNGVRGTTETVEDYLLRHTRLIPRDVVTLGNAMCQQVVKAKARDFPQVSNEVIWQVVDRAAKQFAEQQLGVSANQITADMMPAQSAEHGYADFYVGSCEYSQGKKQELCRILSGIARDRFGADAVAKIRSEGEARFDGYEHVADVLWQNGLLGFELDSSDPGRAHFYTASEADDFGLPERKSYVFHPSLGHRLGLQAVGSAPVRGYPSE